MVMIRTAMTGLILGTVLAGCTGTAAFAEEAPPSKIADFNAESLIKSDGTYWIWGGNHPVPTQVPGLSDVSASFDGGIVMKKDLSVWHWAFTKAATVTVDAIPKLHGLSTVLDTGHELLALEQDGDVYAIPRTDEGQLDWESAEPVDKLQNVVAMTSYYTNSDSKLVLEFLEKDGTLWSGDRDLKSIAAVKTAGKVKSVANNYALLEDGTVQVFPAMYHASGASSDPAAITLMQRLQDIQLVRTGSFSSAAVDKQGRLWFWGSTLTGFSDGTQLHEQAAPILLNGISRVKDAFFVERSLIALTEDGSVYETSIDRESLPADAKFRLLAESIAKIAAGDRHIIMQTKYGAMLGWGINKSGEQGTGGYDYMHDTPLAMQPAVTVQLNGQAVPLSNGVIIRNGQAFIPLRSIFEQLGAKVTWDANAKTVTMKQQAADAAGAATITVDFIKGTTVVNGKPAQLETEPFIISDTTYLPLRVISESLGAKVEWIKEDNRIAITK